MNSTPHRHRRPRPAACGVGVLLVGAPACGSARTTDPASGSPTIGTRSPPEGQFPGASGKVAAVDGTTIQVQSPQDGQVAVTWTASTTFTQEVAASLADVKVGDCVVVTV